MEVTPAIDEWLDAVFLHPVTEPEWYWAPDFDEYWKAHAVPDTLTVEYMTRVFREHARLRRYSLDQVAQGIWFLISETSPAQPSRLLVESSVEFEQRMFCIDAMPEFFRGFVAPAAPGASRQDTDRFHMACYMWWDVFPSYGGPETGGPGLYHVCLSVMEEVLAIPSELCQFSALHGLNHWHLHHAAKVKRIIGAFLSAAAPVSARVREYAQVAIRGMAQ